jgi:chromosome segregation ATPase
MTGGGATRIGGRATVSKSPESDVERLARELGELRTDVEEHKKAVEAQFTQVGERFSTVEHSLQQTSEQLSNRADEIDQRLRDIHMTSLRKEKGGAAVFMFGALLTLIAALI